MIVSDRVRGGVEEGLLSTDMNTESSYSNLDLLGQWEQPDPTFASLFLLRYVPKRNLEKWGVDDETTLRILGYNNKIEDDVNVISELVIGTITSQESVLLNRFGCRYITCCPSSGANDETGSNYRLLTRIGQEVSWLTPLTVLRRTHSVKRSRTYNRTDEDEHYCRPY